LKEEQMEEQTITDSYLATKTDEQIIEVIEEAKALLKQRKEDKKQAEVQVALNMLAETNALGNPTYSMSDVSKHTKVGITRIKKAQAKLKEGK
jgi:hypothetical protein